jgi:WS/DGAT/MGAT family acyltransferase
MPIRGTREPMSKVDTAWLRMERPTNLMMITGVMMFAEPLDLARFKRMIGERFLAFPRFRQKAVDTGSSAYWDTDADFDLDWHVRLTALPGKAGQRELERLASQLASTPLDHSKPLWQFHLVESYRGGSALITRIHHCYADGLALVQVLLSLTDTKPTAEKKAELARTWLKKDTGSVIDRLLQPARAGLAQAVHFGEKLLEKGRELVNDPAQIRQLVQEGGLIARELALALTLPEDPPTPFRAPLGVSKRVAWADPLRLDEVKSVGKGLGCTVNDVLLASATGALRSYLIDLGSEVDGLTIRATVPVNLRPLEHAKKLGNHFGLVFLDLPIGEPNPLRRLERIAASMRELKRSRQAIVAFGLLAALGMSPAALQRPALEMLSRKATTVATNVPGPQMPLYLAGSRIRDLMFWVPQTGSIGMGISILSYNGEVHFGLIVDAKSVPDPSEIIRRFAPEFEKLLLITLMEDWDAEITAADAGATLERYAAGAAQPRSTPPPRAKSATRKPATNGGGAPRPKRKNTPRPKLARARKRDAFATSLEQFRGQGEA